MFSSMRCFNWLNLRDINAENFGKSFRSFPVIMIMVQDRKPVL